VFEKRVLRIFGPKSDEVTREWKNYVKRTLMICTLTKYCSNNKIEKNEMGGACSSMGDRKGVYMVLVGEPEGKRPLERPRRRWEDNIEMGLQKVGCGTWTSSSWLRKGTGGGFL